MDISGYEEIFGRAFWLNRSEFEVHGFVNLTVSLKTMYCRHFFDRFRRSDECEPEV
jgi:hypothetical protein